MKKALVFIIALILMLAMANVSSASIDREETEKVQPYLGIWYSSKGIYQYVLCIAYNTTLEYYTARGITYFYSVNYNNSQAYEYSMTYDKEYDSILLTNSAESVACRVKIKDGKMIVHDLYSNTDCVYNKLEK